MELPKTKENPKKILENSTHVWLTSTCYDADMHIPGQQWLPLLSAQHKFMQVQCFAEKRPGHMNQYSRQADYAWRHNQHHLQSMCISTCGSSTEWLKWVRQGTTQEWWSVAICKVSNDWTSAKNTRNKYWAYFEYKQIEKDKKYVQNETQQISEGPYNIFGVLELSCKLLAFPVQSYHTSLSPSCAVVIQACHTFLYIIHPCICIKCLAGSHHAHVLACMHRISAVTICSRDIVWMHFCKAV